MPVGLSPFAHPRRALEIGIHHTSGHLSLKSQSIRLCPKTPIVCTAGIVDKRHFDHAAEVFGGFLEAREDASAFLEPTDEPLDNVPASIQLLVKLHRPCIRIFVFLGRDYGVNPQADKVLVDPIRAVSFVTGQRHWPGDRLSVAVPQVDGRTANHHVSHGTLIRTKAVVTVSEMARMVGLSRARFYQLMEVGVFPLPVYRLSNRRPIYDEGLQKICLEVRRRNCGLNGQPVLFYTKAHRPMGQAKPTSKAKRKPTTKGQYDDVLDGLRASGSLLSAPIRLRRRSSNSSLVASTEWIEDNSSERYSLRSSAGTPVIMLGDNYPYRPS